MSEAQMSEAQDEQPRRIFLVGDGENDDTAAIQAALDGTGFFPSFGSGIEGAQYHKIFQ